MEQGLHSYLNIPHSVEIYLDNGAFYFLRREGEMPFEEYDAFVSKAKPDWWPIPRDFIPNPSMSAEEQEDYRSRTMTVNTTYQLDGYVPIIHIGQQLEDYIAEFQANTHLVAKRRVGLGGIVPNLLRAPKALPYAEILQGLMRVRDVFQDKQLHLFGIGGTATLHLAALLHIDSVDSSGWRNRAARGIVQLPGRGDRMVAELGKWRGRKPSEDEWQMLGACTCPACASFGVDGIKANGLPGFEHRATHNLWTLLEEVKMIDEQIRQGTYDAWYVDHVSNSTYRPLIDALVAYQNESNGSHETVDSDA
jgi:queuine/archaeosine tRNA-ribosyltransferase